MLVFKEKEQKEREDIILNVRLKKMWKTSNRGLILGLILIVVLVIYISVDKITFNNEKPLIEETLNNYVKELTEVIQTDEAFITSGSKWTSDSLNELKKEYQEVLNKYWTNTFYVDSNYSWGQQSLSACRQNLNDLFDPQPPAADSEYITNLTYRIVDSKITKNGPNGAKVTFDLQCTFEHQGNVSFLGFDGSITNPSNFYWTDSPSDITAVRSFNGTFSLSYDLLREKGEWKISSTLGLGTSVSSEVVIRSSSKSEDRREVF